MFLDLCLYKGERFAKEGILDIKTHIKLTDTQQYIHALSAHPPGTGRGIIKVELLRYLRMNSNEATFQVYKENPFSSCVEELTQDETDHMYEMFTLEDRSNEPQILMVPSLSGK